MISIWGFPVVCTAVWLHLHDEYGEERMQGGACKAQWSQNIYEVVFRLIFGMYFSVKFE